MCSDIRQARINMMNKFGNFIESENPMGLIYAPPQVGKTEAIVKFIDAAISKDMPVIVSCDNKIDQLHQVYERVARTMVGKEVEFLMVTNRKFAAELKEIIRLPSKRYIIFVMNNATQINKLRSTLADISLSSAAAAFRMTTRIAMVHDEADTHIKDADVVNISAAQKASHRAWMELHDAMTMLNVSLKRMFVSATPEAVVMLHKIQNVAVFRLDVPDAYVGYGSSKFNYDTVNTSAKLVSEVRRIKESESCEVILYCMNKAIKNHNDTLIMLNGLVDCTVNTYNSMGIRVMFKTDAIYEDFKQVCDNYNNSLRLSHMKPVVVNDIGNMTLDLKDISIANFYTMCKAAGETCIVTIGKDLIARGISYCSTNRIMPFAATRMFLNVGNAMHNVGITQAVGRIMGTARPELDRVLYANESIISEFKKFNQNQRKWVEAVAASTEEISVKTIIDSTDFCIFKRKIDRPALGLKMRMAYEYDSDTEDEDEEDYEESETDEENEDEEMVEIKRIVNRWWGKDSISGQVLMYVYANGEDGVPYDEMVQFVEDVGSDNANGFVSRLNTMALYSKIYTKINDTFYLNNEVRKCLDAM